MPNKKTENQTSISWTALEFVAHPKTPLWYLGFGVIALGLMVFGIFSQSIITIITFALLIIVAYVFAVKSPRRQTYELDARGIRVNDIIYPYKNIKTFWLVYNPPEVKALNFETTAYLNNLVSIELANQNPVAVKLFLNRYLPEDLDREESFSEVLARKVKF